MALLAGNLTLVGNPFDLSLFFARQPEPDLEFTEEELEQTAASRPITPMKPPKKSGGRPLVWLLLLLLVGGAAYLALEPELLNEWLAPLLGESTPQPQATAQHKPQPGPAVAPPARTAEPAPEPPAAAGGMPAPPPSTPAPSAPPVSPSAAPASGTTAPLFAEGQRVTVMGNPAAPSETVQLMLDPMGTKPGPSVRPGTTLNVLDGDLQPGGWVYSVRTDDGLKGWVQEKRLRMKF